MNNSIVSTESGQTSVSLYLFQVSGSEGQESTSSSYPSKSESVIGTTVDSAPNTSGQPSKSKNPL